MKKRFGNTYTEKWLLMFCKNVDLTEIAIHMRTQLQLTCFILDKDVCPNLAWRVFKDNLCEVLTITEIG